MGSPASEGRRIVDAAREMADRVEEDARGELRRAAEVRDECEERLTIAVVRILDDRSLWRPGPGRTEVLDRSTRAARRRIEKARQKAFAVIDGEYSRMARGLLPRAASGLEP